METIRLVFCLTTFCGFVWLCVYSDPYKQRSTPYQDSNLSLLVQQASCDPKVKNREGCDDAPTKPVILSTDKPKKPKVDKKDKMAHLFVPRNEAERQAKIAEIWHLKGNINTETKIFAERN